MASISSDPTFSVSPQSSVGVVLPLQEEKMNDKHPTWLNEAFIANVLQGGEDKEPWITVLKLVVKPAVAAGNNYSSHLFRVQVEYKNTHSAVKESDAVIIKAPMDKGLMNDLSNEMDFYGTEPIIYNELLPKMNKILNIEFGPKSFYCPIKGGMVLQDLNESGYVMVDKTKQLNLQQCKLVMANLAKYHAASIVIYHEDPKYIENIGAERWYRESGVLKESVNPWLKASVRYCAKMLKEIGGSQKTVNLLLQKADNLWETLTNYCKPNPSGFNVLNHGDCWITNVLFKHNEAGEAVAIKFIDYQIPRYMTPLVDLLFFIWTSANEDVRENKQQELYNIYLNTLNKTLEELGCRESYKSDDLKNGLQSGIDWIIGIICFEMPWMICEPENAVNPESIEVMDDRSLETDERFQKLLNGVTFKALFPGLMRQLGYLISS